MDIYCVTGYCTDYESGSIRQVHEIYATREKAEQGFNDFINETRNFAQEAENIKYLGTSQGMWTEQTTEVHGSLHVIRRYECSVSVDLEDEEGWSMFKNMSVIGLLESSGKLNIADGIHIDHLYSALSFKVANLSIVVKQI